MANYGRISATLCRLERKNTYGVNAETGEYAAYSRPGNEYTSKPEYFRNPNNLSGVSLEQWRNYSTNREGESDLSIWARRLGFRYDTAALDNLCRERPSIGKMKRSD